MAKNDVRVNNLCDWPLYFSRIDGVGSVMIPRKAKNFALLSFDEVQSQIQVDNKMFTGEDGLGSHARIQIVDEAQRRELFGLDESVPLDPVQLDAEAVKGLLAINTKAKFQARLNELVKTNAEKKTLLALAEEVGSDSVAAWKVDALRELASTASL